MAAPQKTLTPEEFQKIFGDALAAPTGSLAATADYPVPDARKRGRGKGFSKVADDTFQPIDFGAPPPSRAVGGMRGKFERDDEFDYRMNQAIPRGARRGGAASPLDQQMLMDEGMGAEEARIKSNIIRSRGGVLGRDKEGKLGQQSATARRAPLSSTGRAYDPVAERAALMANAKAAVAGKMQEQAGQQKSAESQFAASQVPGTMRGMANQYGYGQAKTLTPEEFANRAPGMVTEGRYVPVTNKISEVTDWMKKGQGRK